MKVVFAARRLNPGHYEAFRKAWEPAKGFPEGFIRAHIIRDMNDPDVVITFGLFEVSDERADQLKTELEPSERDRHAAMAPHVAETLVAGLYDVVHEQEGSATGAHTLVPLTERVLRPGALAAYMDAAATAMGGRMPPELVHFIAMSDTAHPEHLIQLGIFRTDDPEGMRESSRGGRQQMLDAIAPHVESTGIDSTFEMLEELTPAHA
jgi:heme-degrading monooxygenase HmoA